jgi:NADH:ubiquinone reductase (H+-translocating)
VRVIVVGTGFAGLSAARALAKSGMQVTVVDRNNFHTFQPLLYQVATAGLDVSDVAYPARTILRRYTNVGFRHGEVTAVDLEKRTVTLRDGSVLEYDELVVATGATAGYFGIPGAAQNAHPLYTLEDARKLRNRLLLCMEDSEARPERHQDGAPCIVVIGGGATGVETAGAIVELLQAERRDDVKLDWARTKVVMVDSNDRLLSGFEERAGSYALDTLRSRGVEVRLSAPVAEVTDIGLRLGGDHEGEEIRADLVIWAGGITVEGTLASSLGVATTKGGRVVVDGDLAVSGHPEVSVVGDAAAVPLGPKGGTSPQLAQVAIQSGRHAASQIVRRHNGLPTEPFRYLDKGQMATIGRRAAVAQLGKGLVIRGVLGWFAWLGLHLLYLIGFRNRLVVLVNWTWRYFDWPSGPRLIVTDGDGTP